MLVEYLWLIKSMVLSFFYIGGRCQEWDLGKLAQFQQLNFGFPVLGLLLSGFLIGGYVCGFSIRGTPARILWVANFRFLLCEICVHNQWEHEILRFQLKTLTLAAGVNVCIYEKVNQALLAWFTSIRGNNIPISGLLLLEELANLLTHLMATLFRHQTDGLEDGMRGKSRLPVYMFLQLKIHNKECQFFKFFYNHRHFHEK